MNGENPATSYTKTAQIKHFKKVLGSGQSYFTSTSYLARGHLTPDADFIFPSAQFATYFYVNACPQFQSVNGGNWLRVESLVRHLAQHYNTDLLVATGSFEQLQLPDHNGQLSNLFLSTDNGIIVPKWLWKVVKNQNINAAIVLITLNNPFSSIENVEEFCENICAKAFLNSKHFRTMSKGYTFCCEIGDFQRTVKSVPNDLMAPNVLSCNNVKFDEN